MKDYDYYNYDSRSQEAEREEEELRTLPKLIKRSHLQLPLDVSSNSLFNFDTYGMIYPACSGLMQDAALAEEACQKVSLPLSNGMMEEELKHIAPGMLSFEGEGLRVQLLLEAERSEEDLMTPSKFIKKFAKHNRVFLLNCALSITICRLSPAVVRPPHVPVPKTAVCPRRGPFTRDMELLFFVVKEVNCHLSAHLGTPSCSSELLGIGHDFPIPSLLIDPRLN